MAFGERKHVRTAKKIKEVKGHYVVQVGKTNEVCMTLAGAIEVARKAVRKGQPVKLIPLG